MQIILEGPDNAGKSTLASHLAEQLGLPLQHSGGPGKYPGEVNTRTFKFNRRRATEIFDRHPAVSQNIYVKALGTDGELVTPENTLEFYEGDPIIIYCRPTDAQIKVACTSHTASEHSTQEHADLVSQHYIALLDRYDRWAMRYANLVYRIGDNMEDMVNAVAAILWSRNGLSDNAFNPFEDIATFHNKFKLVYDGKPRQLPVDIQSFRSGFLAEELDEYEDAVRKAAIAMRESDEAEFVHQLENQADALVDLVYVALGTAYLNGFDFPEMWRRVQAANMAKVRALRNEDSTRGSTYDVVKPPGWEPPRHTDLLEDHAHRDVFSAPAAAQ